MTVTEAIDTLHRLGPYSEELWDEVKEFRANRAFVQSYNTLRSMIAFKETIDNIREALDLEDCRYLVLPDQVRNVYSYVKMQADKGDLEAKAALKRMRMED